MSKIIKMIKKLTAVILCGVIIFSAVPSQAWAADSSNESITVNSENAPVLNSSLLVSVAGWTLKKVSLAAFNSTVSFGVSRLLNSLFPKSTTDDETIQKLEELSSKLDSIAANQEKTYKKLTELENFVTNDQYLDILNDFTQFTTSTSFITYCYNALENLQTDEGEELANRQLSLLTDEIGIHSYQDANTSIDTKRSEYYSYITSQYLVQVEGATVPRNLFGVYRELMRNNYCWENSAAQQINDFNECLVNNYLFITLVDILSIEARIQLIDRHNADPANADNQLNKTLLESLLKNEIPSETQQVLEQYLKYSSDIPENLMHFWKGSEDLWFDSTIYTPTGGNEYYIFGKSTFEAGKIISTVYDSGSNFEATKGFTNRVYQSDFFRGICNENKGENYSLVTADILNRMLIACKNNKTLSEIFTQGNFNGVNNPDYFLLNYDDSDNASGTYKSTIRYKDGDWIFDFKDDVAYLRYFPGSAETVIQADKAGKCDVFCYVDITQHDEAFNFSKTTVFYCNNVTPDLLSCEKVFLYEGEDTCAHRTLTEVQGAKEATCHEEGYTGDTVCLKCGKTVEKGEVIPCSHIPCGEPVNAKTPSCTEEGYTGDIMCGLCESIAVKGTVIEKLPHDYKFDGTNYVCSICHGIKDALTCVCGDFTVSYFNEENKGFTYSNGVLAINTSEPIEIKNTNPDAETTDTIFIEKDTDARIVLAGVNINVSGIEEISPVSVADYSSGNVTVTLKDLTTNLLHAGRNCAAVQSNTTTGSLTIDGSGFLYARAGNNGAAIGSKMDYDVSNIIIKSGMITAVSAINDIGNGKEGSSSDIVIYPEASVNAQTIGCTPVNEKGHAVKLNIIDNPMEKDIYIDGAKFPYTHHNGESKVYVYLTDSQHNINVQQPVIGKNGTVVDNQKKIIYGITPFSQITDCFDMADGVCYGFSGDSGTAATGVKIRFADEQHDYGFYTMILFGDVNCDGIYDGMDSVLVNCMVCGLITKENAGEAVYAAADCNHDGVIDNLDVQLLEQAGVILSEIDQQKALSELAEDSTFCEYLGLISQNMNTEKITADEPVAEEKNPNIFQTVFEFIINIFRQLFVFIFKAI